MITIVRDDKVLRLVGLVSGLQITIDFDDVDHAKVMNDTQNLVTLLNAYGL